MLIIEGLVMCFILLLICVIGIANGPVGLVIFYEQEVKDRVIELGLTTKEKIRKTQIITMIALMVPQLVLPPVMAYVWSRSAIHRRPCWKCVMNA